MKPITITDPVLLRWYGFEPWVEWVAGSYEFWRERWAQRYRWGKR